MSAHPIYVIFVCLGLAASSLARAQYDSFDLEAAPAQPQPRFVNSLEIGAGYQSDDSFFLGRYGGITEDGPFLILKGTLNGGDAWDSESGRFWDAAFDVRGFDTLSFEGRYGEQGRWRLSGFYSSFVRSYSDTAQTPYTTPGRSTLSLPEDWRSSIFSAGFSTLEDSLRPLELDVTWRTVGGDFVFIPFDNTEVRLSFSDRNRKGVRGQNLAFGHEGNFAVGVFFPQPIDYDTNRFTASVSYADERLHWSAAYTFSAFRSDVEAVTVQNPYARSSGTPWPAGAFAGYPFAIGQYSLPPDSSAHQVSLNGGYALSPVTRVRLVATYMQQKQNDDFLPYTIVPELTVFDPLPRTSLDGKVEKTFIKLDVSSRPSRNVTLSAHYKFDDRNNKSPVDTYNYVANDALDQPQPIIPGNSRYIRLNIPHSFTFHQAKAEVSYRIKSRTRVSLTYTGDFKARADQQVANTDTHKVKGKVLSSFATGSAWLALTYSDRSGSEYNDELPWDLSHTESYLAASPFNQSIEHPLLRKYNMADRSRTEIKGSVSVSPTIDTGVTLIGSYAEDSYSKSALGLRQSDALLLSSDFSYQVTDAVLATGFYSVEEYRSDQNGYLIFGLDESNPDQEWRVDIKDRVFTAGFTVDWEVRPDEVSLGWQYYLSDGTSRTDVQTRPFNVLTETAPLPDAEDKTHTVSLRGEYAFRPDLTLRAGYTLEWHRSRDWQYDDIGFTPVTQILGSGILSPRYTAHIGWATIRYQF